MAALGINLPNWDICSTAASGQKLAIEREERHLQARFGKTYVDYTERVRRWI
jgi:protein-S-isoprenylcysteine O-methyltransferase Ste14